jgi:hypothetical protein
VYDFKVVLFFPQHTLALTIRYYHRYSITIVRRRNNTIVIDLSLMEREVNGVDIKAIVKVKKNAQIIRL